MPERSFLESFVTWMPKNHDRNSTLDRVRASVSSGGPGVTAEPGRLLHDRYRLGPELGRGGMAVVRRAHDELLDRPVAVKVVRKADLTADDRQRLLHEARLAARLNHPNIVTVYDAGEVDGEPYIVMELVDGEPLFGRPPADLAETVAVASQLCLALGYAHEQGVVHRDVKPENILRTAEGTVKLTDFGLALSPASRISRDGIVAGTVFYLAPEQLQGRPIDGRADLYALGVLLYQWTTGELPFAAPEALGVIAQHLYAPVVAPRAQSTSVPPVLDRLILRLLSKSPDDRPSSAREVLDVLQSPQALELEARPAEVPLLERIGRGRMAGREAELAVARRLWVEAAAGESRLLLLSGEAGIGKTRLVREITALAEVSRGRVLEGSNYAQAGEPFGAFRQILRGEFDALLPTIRSLPDSVAAAAVSIAHELHPHFPNLPLPNSVDSVEQQQRHFEGAAVLLSRLSEASPVLLVVEDGHWADSGTLRLFRYLVQQTRRRRVLFVLTYRAVEPSEAPLLHEVLHDFRREGLGFPLTLARLDRAKTESMLTSLLGGKVAPELAREVFQVTEGNPFFIEEVCKGLAERGRLVLRDGLWNAAGGPDLGIPVNVRVAITGRMRSLPDEARQALEVAAVRGRQFGFDLLQRTLGWEPVRLTDALEAAGRAQIIESVSGPTGPRYAFTHSLIPAVVLEELPASLRQHLHRQLAPVLEALRPDEVESLALHFRAAGDPVRAAGYFLKAGERAQALYALPETIANYMEACRLQTEAGQHEEAARTLLRLGLVYSTDFQFDQARKTYERAFDHWERRRQPETAKESPVTLRFAIDEPLTLDPGLVVDDVSAFVQGQLFEGLIELDEAMGIVPALARRWDVSDDGRRYTFHLRPGAKWSDGSPVTAYDFEFAWKRNLALGPGTPARLDLTGIAGAQGFIAGETPDSSIGVRARDDRTLDVQLEQPAGYFPLLLTLCVTYPLPRHVVEGGRQPWTDVENLVSNGPFRLIEWQRGHRMVFEASPYYDGLRRGNVVRIESPIIMDFDSLLADYDRGELDGISLIKMSPGTFQTRVLPGHRGDLSITPALSTLYLAFRATRPPFDRAEVRQAFVCSIDREEFVRQAGMVYLTPAHGGFLPPGMAGHSASIGLPHDPDAARRLLAGGGYPGGKGFPAVELAYSGDAGSDATAAFLARAWEGTLGVKVELARIEFEELLRRGREDPPDLTISGWAADYPDPDDMLRVVFHGHPFRWRNAAFDALVEEAARITDARRRIELYREADRILVAEEAAVLPLGYAQGRQLVKPYVRLPRTPPYLLRLKNAVVQRG